MTHTSTHTLNAKATKVVFALPLLFLQIDQPRTRINRVQNSTHMLVSTLFVLSLIACKKEANVTTKAPIAVIQTYRITSSEARKTIPLNGAFSLDNTGKGLSYNWKMIEGPSPLAFTTLGASRTIVSGFQVGAYSITLTVKDKSGQSDTDTGYLYIIPNKPPLAHAGFDQIARYPDTTFLLDGSASLDMYDDIVKYQWKQIEGPDAAIISSPDSAKTKLLTKRPGFYSFQLSAFDANNSAGLDSVSVEIIWPHIANNYVIYEEQKVICPWDCYTSIENYRTFFSSVSDTLRSVQIRRSGTTQWKNIDTNFMNPNWYGIGQSGLDIYVDFAEMGNKIDIKLNY